MTNKVYYDFHLKTTANEYLTYKEKKIFNEFFTLLIKKDHLSKIIFRGDNYNNFKTKLNLYGNNDYQKVNSFLFLIGEKGRVYQNDYKQKIANKNKIYPINSVNDSIFKYIFNKLNYLFSKKTENQEIKLFIDNNAIFFKYFLDKKNLYSFLQIIDNVKNIDCKITIRDYYLSLLHKIGQIGFYNNSFFLSTTTRYETAVDFSRNETNSERMIIMGWIPYPLRKFAISFNYIIHAKKNISLLRLPTYEKSFYLKQNEISLKGGLLPHYILGYLKYSTNEFIVNPNLFIKKYNYNELIANGLHIDQTNFYDKLKETDYSGFLCLENNRDIYDFN